MALTPSSMAIILALFVLAYVSYSLNRVKSNVYCMFLRADGSWRNKWAKPKQTRIEFDGGWYYIRTARIIHKIMDDGLFMLFPTKVDALIFKHDSPVPLDPKTFKNDWETPEARRNLNKVEDIRALEEGNKSALGKQKVGALQQWMPLIVLIGFLALGYMVWRQQGSLDAIGRGQNYLESVIGKLVK